jgi:hypothetical protein
MPDAKPESPAPADARSSDGPLDRVSHGYAPDGRPVTPPPVPLDKIVGDVVDNVQSTVKAELALLEARGELALHGVTPARSLRPRWASRSSHWPSARSSRCRRRSGRCLRR